MLKASGVELTDLDIDVLADAFTEGCFSQLKKLSLTTDYMTDSGAVRLAEVLQHSPLLEKLLLSYTKMRQEGCEALASAVVTGCPAMKKLVLPGGNGTRKSLVLRIGKEL